MHAVWSTADGQQNKKESSPCFLSLSLACLLSCFSPMTVSSSVLWLWVLVRVQSLSGSRQISCGRCDFPSRPAPISVWFDRLPVVGGTDDILKKLLPTVPFCLLCACSGLWVGVFSLFVFSSLALPAEPFGLAQSFFTWGMHKRSSREPRKG